MRNLIDTLYDTSNLRDDQLLMLLDEIKSSEDLQYLFDRAVAKKKTHYKDAVYMRGLIEFTNYCKQNCNYCGIRNSNTTVDRYRLDKNAILSCCKEGYQLGYRTFVLQGGEDPYYTDARLVDIIRAIKSQHPDCAITLSIGERSKESYVALKEAGTDRYLLRHETASKALYESLHPNMSFENRRACLYTLRELNYQIGAGFMVGLPNQTNEDLVEDLRFLKSLSPEMIGIGPYIPHDETPLKGAQGGTVEKTLILLALTRLLVPEALLPSTTAMGTLDPNGREKALKAGANVVMPNLSPTDVREKYELYKDKICTGDEAAHCRQCIEGRIKKAGFSVDMGRGDHTKFKMDCTSNALFNVIA
ncbi:[FeFe] hydrogenase H-cluster radical SAM maturase HydE [Fusibacter ferrireducens]|uniref:[FeFe] hydrogenase H-cluster radical SAM maturase HydE n=1 Tax=Fusibacter ferrireducens TaxID=2785058 RepID=A0ABR9ZTK6_9FIRM|nr:[FeFe] hydrogenase H-cluster radical SAM maturase HydE [Fusibacter ferrireducens]MBF4692899.1 [FeFe] hydrogenase H-cluster radical SAM maturase HydE [Fusibacter ferrireducens]